MMAAAAEKRGTELRSKSLLEQSLILGADSKASHALLLREIRVGYADRVETNLRLDGPGCPETYFWVPLKVEIDAVLVRVSDGQVAWTGQVEILGSDLFTKPVTVRIDPGCKVSLPGQGYRSLMCLEHGHATCAAAIQPDRRDYEFLIRYALGSMLH